MDKRLKKTKQPLLWTALHCTFRTTGICMPLFYTTYPRLATENIAAGILNTKGKKDEMPAHKFMQAKPKDSSIPFRRKDLFQELIKAEFIPKNNLNKRTANCRTASGLSRARQFVLYTLEQPKLLDARLRYSIPASRSENLVLKQAEGSFQKQIGDFYEYLSDMREKLKETNTPILVLQR